ncbi:hypothetical protein [Streptomyces sp. NPDC018031]|uniref:hypothetical protein n=1 Tax=Streptomyces sp. NPDC018031 TaxID=3365033 RepID=UPI0037B9F460
MRMLLTARMDTRTANEAIKTGALPQAIQGAVDQLQPEAVYFTSVGGRRAGLFFFDMQDPSQIPAICEPFFMELDADVEIKPVMDLDDLRKGLAALEG